LRQPLESAQFVSLAFGQKARAAGIAQSMGSKSDCFDNAVAESFFATLKKELIYGRSWRAKAELRTEVFEVHRSLLQPPPPALCARNALARRVRDRSRPTD
jgi:transposase InsO family protein